MVTVLLYRTVHSNTDNTQHASPPAMNKNHMPKSIQKAFNSTLPGPSIQLLAPGHFPPQGPTGSFVFYLLLPTNVVAVYLGNKRPLSGHGHTARNDLVRYL